MNDPASPARPVGLYAALCLLVPFGGALPVVLTAPSTAAPSAARFAFAYPWPGAPRRP